MAGILVFPVARDSAGDDQVVRLASRDDYDVIVVGAGLSGLTTALELGRAGVRVAVVDMASVFGGHAVMANGDLSIVATPLQKTMGIDDSPARAMTDVLHWGGSKQTEWVEYYAQNSRIDIYDWLLELGVTFENVLQGPGDSVARVHLTKGRGIGLVSPVYRECLRYPNIAFYWNQRVTRLQAGEERMERVIMTDLRSGMTKTMAARAIVLATGGFQSNLDMVRQYWAEGLPFPERFLAGSGIHSMGEGHRLAEDSGGSLTGMERQMNLSSGIVDPRSVQGDRGLNAGNKFSVWVNLEGERFVNERTKPEQALPVVLRQPGMTYWMIFDEETKGDFRVSGSDWGSFARIDELILRNPKITRVADSWEELAARTGLPSTMLRSTLERYNRMIEEGQDTEFKRFARDAEVIPPKIQSPPFYAVQFFPLTRKSMGGVSIDLSCRVLDVHGQVIPGLYAVGELTGSAGINGESGMSGMFLGPCVLMGRVASRAIVNELQPFHQVMAGNTTEHVALAERSSPRDTAQCMQCHDLPALIEKRRDGYWHFDQVHRKVLTYGQNCADCHSEVATLPLPDIHRIDHRNLSFACVSCHVANE